MQDSAWICANDWSALLFRLVLALLAGGAIGLNREVKRKPAGLRTHMLVSLGAALFVLVPIQVDCLDQSPEAVSRTIQGVAAGVGFLGAGEILQQSRQDSEKPRIIGLTSASAIWVAAGLGVASGAGLWQLVVLGALLALAVLVMLKPLEEKIETRKNKPE